MKYSGLRSSAVYIPLAIGSEAPDDRPYALTPKAKGVRREGRYAVSMYSAALSAAMRPVLIAKPMVLPGRVKL